MREMNFTSADGTSPLYAYIWTPPDDVAPVGILQIVHGFSEHLRRYSDFAGFMAARGFVVCGHDQLGHGKSAAENLGHVGKKGHKLLAKDVYKLTTIIKKEYDLPLTLIGIGGGSLVARYAVSLWGIEYDGAVFSGTMDGGLVINTLHRLFFATKTGDVGQKQAAWVNKIIARHFGRPFRKHPDGESWLSRDAAQVAAFEADTLCGPVLTYGSCQNLLKLARITNSHKWHDRMPKNLPIYLFSGLEDPVGGFGRGVINVYAGLVNAGCANVEIRLYEDARHEMLFELNRTEVYEDVIKWINEAVLGRTL